MTLFDIILLFFLGIIAIPFLIIETICGILLIFFSFSIIKEKFLIKNNK